MTYVDGFLLVIPKKNVKAYVNMAKDASKVWIKHGALQYFECVGDDLEKPMMLPFPKLTKAKKSDTVWFSFIVYKNKAHRNKVNKLVMADPALAKFATMKMPFDMKKMSVGGFKVVIEKR